MRALLFLFAMAGPGWAANLSCPQGTLTPTAITATATSSANTVSAHAAPALVFQAVNTAGTATAEIDICCVGTCDLATGSWAQVQGSSMSLTVNSIAVGVSNPACLYRALTTACTGCNVTVGFACAGP